MLPEQKTWIAVFFIYPSKVRFEGKEWEKDKVWNPKSFRFVFILRFVRSRKKNTVYVIFIIDFWKKWSQMHTHDYSTNYRLIFHRTKYTKSREWCLSFSFRIVLPVRVLLYFAHIQNTAPQRKMSRFLFREICKSVCVHVRLPHGEKKTNTTVFFGISIIIISWW